MLKKDISYKKTQKSMLVNNLHQNKPLSHKYHYTLENLDLRILASSGLLNYAEKKYEIFSFSNLFYFFVFRWWRSLSSKGLQPYKWSKFCFYKVGDEMGAFTFEKLLRFCTRVEWVVTCLFWEIRQINCHPNDPDSPSGFWYRIGITRAKRVLGFKAMVPQISV